MEITLRDYGERDLEYVKSSFEKLHDHVITLDPIKRIRKMPGYLDVYFKKFLNNIKNNQGKIYIGTHESKPIGFIGGFVADKQTEENKLEVIPSQIGIISTLYIDMSYRGKGVGTKLMKAMEHYLVGKKCDALWIDTNGFNTQALRLYKSVGYSEREVGLLKKLS